MDVEVGQHLRIPIGLKFKLDLFILVVSGEGARNGVGWPRKIKIKIPEVLYMYGVRSTLFQKNDRESSSIRMSGDDLNPDKHIEHWLKYNKNNETGKRYLNPDFQVIIWYSYSTSFSLAVLYLSR